MAALITIRGKKIAIAQSEQKKAQTSLIPIPAKLTQIKIQIKKIQNPTKKII